MKILSAIWGWFSGSSIGKYLIEGFLLIGSLGAIYEKIRLDGIHAQQGKDAEATLKDVAVSNRIQQQVSALPPDKVDDELASKYSRP